MTRNKNGLYRPLVFFQILCTVSLSLQGNISFASTQDDAMQWIQKMSHAMQQYSYKGHFVYLHDGQLESMSIVHVKDAQGNRERLVSLNGEAREILRDNKNLTCIWPSSKQVVVDQVRQTNDVSPIWIPEDVKRLSKYYEFTMSGSDRIADHKAVVVSIQPKDEFRYGMKVWLDIDTGLLVQSSVLNGKGDSVEQVMFTDLNLLNDEQQKAFSVLPKIDDSYALIRSHQGADGNRVSSDDKWQIKSLPGGFWLETSFRKKMTASEDFTQHMILTDGMASVSVFIEGVNDQQLIGESSMGAVNAYGTHYNKFSITAIGEVPAITVQTIANAVVYENSSDSTND
jgi:sigma-E factor negative regulatory protein RseB